MYILLVYERESVEKWLSKTSTNNNYKKHQNVNNQNKNKSYYLKAFFPM